MEKHIKLLNQLENERIGKIVDKLVEIKLKRG